MVAACDRVGQADRILARSATRATVSTIPVSTQGRLNRYWRLVAPTNIDPAYSREAVPIITIVMRTESTRRRSWTIATAVTRRYGHTRCTGPPSWPFAN